MIIKKWLGFRPTRLCLRCVCTNACIHLYNVPLKKRKQPLGSALAVSEPGLWMWEREKGEGYKENGCKRFGQLVPCPPVSEKPLSHHFEGTSESRTRESLQNSSRLLPSSGHRRRASPPIVGVMSWRSVSREYGKRVFRAAREFRGGLCHGLGITILFHRALIIRPAIAI